MAAKSVEDVGGASEVEHQAGRARVLDAVNLRCDGSTLLASSADQSIECDIAEGTRSIDRATDESPGRGRQRRW